MHINCSAKYLAHGEDSKPQLIPVCFCVTEQQQNNNKGPINNKRSLSQQNISMPKCL